MLVSAGGCGWHRMEWNAMEWLSWWACLMSSYGKILPQRRKGGGSKTTRTSLDGLCMNLQGMHSRQLSSCTSFSMEQRAGRTIKEPGQGTDGKGQTQARLPFSCRTAFDLEVWCTLYFLFYLWLRLCLEDCHRPLPSRIWQPGTKGRQTNR